MNDVKRFGALSVVLILAACTRTVAPVPAEPADTRAANEAAIRTTAKAWSAAAEAKDLEKFLSFYSDDAVLMLGAAPDYNGLPAIREAVTGMMQDPNFALSFQTTSVEVARSGDLARELCTWSLTMSDAKTKQPTTEKGNCLTVWRKVGDQWKAAVDAPITDPS